MGAAGLQPDPDWKAPPLTDEEKAAIWALLVEQNALIPELKLCEADRDHRRQISGR